VNGKTVSLLFVAACIVMLSAITRLHAQSSAGASSATNAESIAAFESILPVLHHPRCMNCHTGEPFPRQGDDEHRHTPNVARGPNDTGAAGLHCSACHQVENQAASGVPGAPDWHLAPVRMAWQGLSAGDLCRALQDPARGAMSPEQLRAHFNTGLVEWAWAPGTDRTGKERTPPPVGRDEFIALTKAWIDAGAVCPQ